MQRMILSEGKSAFAILQISALAAALLLFFGGMVYAQWYPDAGYIPSYTMGATVSAASTHGGSDANNAIDRNTETYWMSAGCLPLEYLKRTDLDVLLGTCENGLCRSSTIYGSGSLVTITDGNTNTGPILLVQNGEAWFELEFENPAVLNIIGARVWVASSSAAPITLTAITPTGTEIVVGTFSNATDGYPLPFKNFDAPDDEVKILRVSSSQQFQMMELAAMDGPPFETITIDFGETKEIAWIEKLNKSSMHVTSIVMQTSNDNENWMFIANLDPAALSWVKINLETPVYARYLRLVHELEPINYAKALLYEVKVYDEFGPYAPFPTAQINTHTMSELIGVNGYRHWGTSIFSDLLSENEGPLLFRRFASHGRSYHNWRSDLLNWTGSDPLSSNPPHYEDGWSTGINWSREYGVWTNVGMEVEATIQFHNARDAQGNVSASTLLLEEFDGYDPIEEARKFGEKFAGYFGSPDKNVVKVLEVGNEPWNYPADFYRDILYGMAQGVKEKDPNMVVLPCALYAHEPEEPAAAGGRYIGARLSEREIPYIDGLNIHVYSWTYDAYGNRIGVQPEHPQSEINAVCNMIRFRDQNPLLAEKPIYVTETGWDSDGCGQSCDHSECISEYAQAAYAVRSALMFARLGLDRYTWYNYSNDLYIYLNPQRPSTIWTRSGVTCSTEGMLNLPLKKSFIAFEALVNTLGDRHFVSALQEDEEAWVYLLGDVDGTPTHLVAWRPIDVDRDILTPVTISTAVNGQPGNAWVLGGDSPQGEPVPSPVADGGVWTFNVVEVPLVVEIISGPGSVTGTVSDNVGPITGAIIDLYNSENALMASHSTTAEGWYTFIEVEPGSYTVEMITPLGYATVSAKIVTINVAPGQDCVVDFELQRKDIFVDARGSGFWKHQVKSLISGKGNAQETEEALLGYLQSIKLFWDYFDGIDESLEGLQDVLDLPKQPTMKEKAEKELMPLLLNVTSERIATFTVISSDDNVGEAIDYTLYIFEDQQSGDSDFEKVKDICEAINNGNIPLNPADIPESLPKRQARDAMSEPLPTRYELYPNYPNPFNPSTTITYALPKATHVSLLIYNAQGQIVRTLVAGQKTAGVHPALWDALDDSGASVSNGIYLVVLKAGAFISKHKMLCIK